MTNKSNDRGRAFEYCIANELFNFLQLTRIPVDVTESYKKDNLRDSKYFNSSSAKEKSAWVSCAKAFIGWITNNHWFQEANHVNIDRLKDSQGRVGNPTDIALTIKTPTRIVYKNISVKSNHNDLKHQRLTNLPNQCGITNLKIKKEYLEAYGLIWDNFIKEAKSVAPEATAFKELKKAQHDFIDKKLYMPINKLVVGFLNNAKELGCFFSFITSNTDFYGIKYSRGKVTIKHFVDIKKPAIARIEYPFEGRCLLFLQNSTMDGKLVLGCILRVANF